MGNYQMSPEEVQAYMHQLTLEQQDQELQQQMAMAHDLRQPGPQRYGGIGAGLQAIADTINSVRGKNAMQDAMQARHGLWNQMEQGRNTIGQGWRNSQTPQEPEIPASIAHGPEDMSGGGMSAQALIPYLLRRPQQPQQAQAPQQDPNGLPNLGVQPVPPPMKFGG
jgi:hypothetical protein